MDIFHQEKTQKTRSLWSQKVARFGADLGNGFRLALATPFRIWLSIKVALVVFVVITTVNNWSLVWDIFASDFFAFGKKLSLFINLLGSIGSNFTLLGAISVIMLSILFGITISLLVVVVKQNRSLSRYDAGKSLGGALLGFLGIGCAACGTLILGPIFSLLGVTGLISSLPLHGEEFSILGVLLLLWTVATLARRITEPKVCEV